MREVHLALEGQTNESNPLISVYWDYQNARLNPHQAKLLLDFANAKGRLVGKNIYYNSLCKNQAFVKDELASLGLNCLDVPCPLKNSADNQLIADCIGDVNNNLSPNKIILVSGDGDFAGLVRNLRRLSIKVIILAQRGNVKQRLKEIADEFYFLEQLPELVKDKTQIALAHCITYNDAIEYLLETIKTALSQGKHTGLPLIDNLMRKRFPNYQGAASILKKDGTPFSHFSKFVAAAVEDGKIKMQLVGKFQQLFLVEEDRQTA